MKSVAFLVIIAYAAPVLADGPTVQLRVGQNFKVPSNGWFVTDKSANEAYNLNLKLQDVSKELDLQKQKYSLLESKLQIYQDLDAKYETKITQIEKDFNDYRKIQPIIYGSIAVGSLLIFILGILAYSQTVKALK